MAVYPTTLPPPLFKGFDLQQEQTYYKTKMDYSAVIRPKSFVQYRAKMTFRLSSAQLGVFNYWYYTTLSNGSEIFTASWNIAGYAGEMEYQFAESGQPKPEIIAPNTYDVLISVDILSDLAFRLANNNLIGYCDVVSCQYNLLNAVSNLQGA